MRPPAAARSRTAEGRPSRSPGVPFGGFDGYGPASVRQPLRAQRPDRLSVAVRQARRALSSDLKRSVPSPARVNTTSIVVLVQQPRRCWGGRAIGALPERQSPWRCPRRAGAIAVAADGQLRGWSTVVLDPADVRTLLPLGEHGGEVAVRLSGGRRSVSVALPGADERLRQGGDLVAAALVRRGRRPGGGRAGRRLGRTVVRPRPRRHRHRHPAADRTGRRCPRSRRRAHPPPRGRRCS